jgi:catechol 2,3-dioxygenase-like lactoylglutathione lyase family enzyme
MMDQRVSLITLGVEDLARSRAFYEGLGWRVASTEPGIAVFNLHGAALGLYPRADLARDMGAEPAKSLSAVTLDCNVREKSEIAPIVAAAEKAGARILKPPHDVFWGGHIAYFADPDGIVWEIAWNPHAPLDETGAFQWGAA